MMIEVACGVMYNSENKILMGKRPNQKYYAGYWEFPGGQLEQNETIEECLIREWEEELNLKINIEKEIYAYHYDNKYFCRFFKGTILDEENMKINEHEEIKFLLKDDVYNLKLFEGDTHVLDKL
jgi:8-oxo-dGTP diphosphatase